MNFSLEISIAVASIAAAICISAIGALIFLRNERIKFDERSARRALMYARALDRSDSGLVEKGIAIKELRSLGYIPNSEVEAFLAQHKEAWVEVPVVTPAVELSVGIGGLRLNLDLKNVLSNLAAAAAVASAGAGLAAAISALTL